jgi:[ribosomal protein S18]-alanine N-acetyltransferase
MAEYIVRRTVFEDLKPIKKIEQETLLSSWTEADLDALMNNPEAITLSVSDSENGKIAGFLLARLITSAREAEILNFAVRPEYQRKGVGGRLLGELISELKNREFTTLWLEVRASNRKAQKFYLKNGFIKAGVRRFYYRNPVEDAFVLKLDLEVALASLEKLL